MVHREIYQPVRQRQYQPRPWDLVVQREMSTIQAAAVPAQASESCGTERDINHSGSGSTSQTIGSCGTERDINHASSY